MVDLLADVSNIVIDHLQNTLLMHVSKEKSTVVAGKQTTAPAIAERVADGVVKAASHAVFLAVDTVGGTRRCTYQLRAHPSQFIGKVAMFGALREAGANAQYVVRARKRQV